MRKTLAALAGAGLVTAVMATAPQADARGGGWEKVPDVPPYTTHDCGTTITITTTQNNEWSRTTTDANGTIRVQTTGANKALVTTTDGRSARLNASGPSWQTLDRAGVYTYDGRGLNLFTLSRATARELGLPKDSVMSGPVTIRVNADGSVTLVRRPAHVRDACALLR